MIVSPEGGVTAPPRQKNPWLRVWAPTRLTWWVAILFTIGSACFTVGGYAISFPQEMPLSVL